jgi:hypothetical protein
LASADNLVTTSKDVEITEGRANISLLPDDVHPLFLSLYFVDDDGFKVSERDDVERSSMVLVSTSMGIQVQSLR